MAKPTIPAGRGKDRTETAPATPRRRRRTLGLCAHCHEPVDVDGEHVRIYRRAWHLECALAADTLPASAPRH